MRILWSVSALVTLFFVGVMGCMLEVCSSCELMAPELVPTTAPGPWLCHKVCACSRLPQLVRLSAQGYAACLHQQLTGSCRQNETP